MSTTDPRALAKALDHIKYEVEMLEFGRQAIRDRRAATEDPDQSNDLNAYLESFTIHARAIAGFLFFRDKETDMFADDFVRDVPAWKRDRGTCPQHLDVRGRVGKEIAHLTYARAEIGPEARAWDTDAIGLGFRELMERFGKHVRQDILLTYSSVGRPRRVEIGVGTTTVIMNTTMKEYTFADIVLSNRSTG